MSNQDIAELKISSPAFAHNGEIPSLYTCEGTGINPALEIGDWPASTKSLALIVEDPDAPGGIFDHWVVWNITPTHSIAENSIPGVTGINSAGKTSYHPPCPPKGSHRYNFSVFALDKTLSIVAGEDKQALMERMHTHIVAKGILTGTYEKQKQPAK